MKHRERLIGAGLIGSVLTAAASLVIFWLAGRSRDLNWPLGAALEHPGWLVIGEVLAAVAWALAAASLSVLGVRHGGSSAFVSLGVLCLVASIPGAALVVGLDLGYATRAQDGVLRAIQFGQRWNWWSGVGWVLFAIGGALGLFFLGIGLARGNLALRYPGIALAGSLVATCVFAPAVILLAASLCWLAIVVERVDVNALGGTRQPAR